MIKLFHPFVSWRAIFYALDVLVRGTQLAEGPMVKRFELEYARKMGINHYKHPIIALNSGTSALELAYELAKINEGDEVITPVLTCTATNLPLVHRKATIVYADTDATLRLNMEDADRRITDKTKAIVVVFFGGAAPTDFKEYCTKWQERGIKVIVDAAQALGPKLGYFGAPLDFADFTCISFQAIKFITTGDGGALICKNMSDTHKARRLRWFGYDRDMKQKFGDTDLVEAGYKYHMNDICAALGLGNLKAIDRQIRIRTKILNEYVENCKGSTQLIILPWLVGLISVHAPLIQEELKKAGIGSGAYHFRNDKYTILGPRRIDLPMMDLLENKYIFLPYHHKMKAKDVRKIMEIVNAFHP